MYRLAMAAVAVLTIALLAGCVDTAEDDADEADDDSVATTESPTPEPTEEPTEEPDPTETPEPEETPTPEPEETPTPEPEETATPEPDDGEDDGDDDGEEHVVEMQDSEFAPDEIEIAVGDTVTWVNEGELVHTSTADPEEAQDEENVQLPDGAETWNSGNMDPGDEFSVTFDVPGEYMYFCIPHEAVGMVGTIVVTEDGGDDSD